MSDSSCTAAQQHASGWTHRAGDGAHNLLQAAHNNRGSQVSQTDDQHAELARIEIERHDGHCNAFLVGELDMSNAEEIYQQLLSATEGNKTIMVDLSRLAFIDSAGVAVLDRLNRALADGPISLRINAHEGSVAARTLALAGMDQVLPMASNDTASRDPASRDAANRDAANRQAAGHTDCRRHHTGSQRVRDQCHPAVHGRCGANDRPVAIPVAERFA